MRTYAIWGNNAKVATGLIVLLVGMFSGTGYFLQQFLNSVLCKSQPYLTAKYSPHAYNGFAVVSTSPGRDAFPGCFVMKAGQILWVAYLFVLIFETSK